MGFFKKALNAIKNWVTGGGKSSKSSSSSKKSSRSSSSSNSSRSTGSYYGSSRSAFKAQLDEEERKRKEKEQQLKNAFKANASMSSSSSSSSSSSEKKTPPDPKQQAFKASQKRITQKLSEIESKQSEDPKEALRKKARQRREVYKAIYNKDAYNKATKDKYNVEKNGSEARRAQKSQAYDVNAEKYETKAHPIATSAGRGALSGVTFGGSELLAQKSKNRKKSGAEEFYQKNKSKGAETVGEIAGSLAGFGLTGGASKAVGTKVGNKTAQQLGRLAGKELGENALERVGSKAATRLAENSIVKRAAQRELDLAVKQGLVKASDNAMKKQLLKEFAENRAKRIVGAVGEDMAINLTTGAASDVSHAILDSDSPEEFAKNMGINAAVNLGLGGLTSVAPALRTRGGLPFIGGVRQESKEIIDNALNRRARDAMQGAFADTAQKAGRVDMGEILARNMDNPRPPEVRPQNAVPEVRPQIETPIQPATEIPTRSAEIPQAPTQPRPEVEGFPYEGTPEAEAMNRRINEGKLRNAETYANEREALEGRVRELENEPPRIEGEEPLRYNNVAEDAPIGGSTIGERMAKSAYERNTGETLDEGIKTSWHDAWNASREYHASHATGRDVRASKTSVSQLNMMDSDAEREIRDKLFDEGWLDYTVVHTDEMLDRVSKEFRDDPKRWVDDMIDVNNGRKLDFRETPEWQARVHYIMAVVDPSADSASEIAYTEAYKLATQMSSKAGQTNNLRRQFVHLTPAGRRDAIMDEMAQILYNSQGFHNAHKDIPSDKYDALAYVKEFLEGDEEIEKRVQKLVEVGGLRRDAEYGLDTAADSAARNTSEGFASIGEDMPLGEAPKASTSKSDSDEIMEAHADLILALNQKNPKTAFDVVQEIRYLNMLGNPKTHIRNVFGSGFFAPIRQLSNALRAGIEKTSLVKNSGLDVTLHGGLSWNAVADSWRKNPTSEAGKKAKDAFKRLKPELLGSMKLDNQLYEGRAKTLAGKALDKVSDFNSKLLSGEDDFFKQKAFRENYIKSYEAYVKRGTPITKKIEKRIEAEAMQEAQIATFNEYNEFAKYLSNLTRKAGDPNASAVGKGVGIFTNAVMPFTKVPANIMRQSVNYSPIGLAKGYSNIRNAIKKGDSELMNKAIDELASGLTGSGIFLLGLHLGRTSDAFTTNAGKDDAAAKFKKAQGVQNYSVTFTNKLDGKKYSMTLDWLVPNSATFFAGVELANQMRSGDFDVLDFGGDWAQIVSRIVEPVMETSMLSGLYSVLESSRNSYGDDDKQSAASIMIRETVQSYLNSLAPTALGQISRSKYRTDLQITGEDDWEYWRNQMKSKVGLGESDIFGEALGADTDAYGNVKGDKGESGYKNILKPEVFLKNFISPANIQKVDLDEVDQAKIKQYEDAVKNGADPTEMAYLFPKKQYKKQFTTGNMDVKLSNKDLSAYNQAKTTGGSEGARYALESIMFNRYTKDENGKKQSTDDAYTPEQKAAVIKQFEGKSIREVEKWVREQPQFKSATEAEQKKVIDGLWSYSKQGKAQSAKRVGEQAVIEAQGGDVNEYNFNNEITEKKRTALQPFIDNGTITYEQAVDFARFAGKTYYYEDDEGGHSQTYYNKGVMMDYLKSKGYDDETAAALFNAFKASNAKEYGASSYRRGRRRRGWRRWGRHGGGKAKTPALRTDSAFKAKAKLPNSKSSSSSSASSKAPTVKRSYKSMASSARTSKSTNVNMRGLKLTPPTPKKGGKKS